jgi:hypothetical protein
MGAVSVRPSPWPEPDAQVVAAIRAIYRRKDLPLQYHELLAHDLHLIETPRARSS